MTIEDTLTRALLNGHAMTTFVPDPLLTRPTSTGRAGGSRMCGFTNGSIQRPRLNQPSRGDDDVVKTSIAPARRPRVAGTSSTLMGL
jgi:hypothetical protein